MVTIITNTADASWSMIDNMIDNVDEESEGGSDSSSSDDSESETEDVPLYENVGNRCSEKYGKQVQTAVNAYNNFLELLHLHNSRKYPYKSLAETPKEHFRNYRETFGMFPRHLLDILKIKHGSANGYVSKVKNLICSSKYNEESDIGNESWFRKLNANTKKIFYEKAIQTGEALSNSAPPMTTEDLNCLATLLLRKNCRTSLSQRCLLVMQWQALGRISEIARMKFLDISWNASNSSIRIKMKRGKTGKSHDVNIFKHASSWRICPFHALGEYLLLTLYVCLYL